MNSRIKRFMEYRGLSSSEFADMIGVQRSNITHVLHGRNKPGFQFITKMLEAFPELNAKWLLTGEGDMLTENKEVTSQKDLFSQILPPSREQQEPDLPPGLPGTEKDALPEQKLSPEMKKAVDVTPMPRSFQGINTETSKKIELIVVFYTDQTFRQYTPSE